MITSNPYRRTTVSSDSSDLPKLSAGRIVNYARYLPITLAMIWLWGSVALFAFGPYDYPVQNPLVLYSYLTAAHLALFLGYCSKSKGQGAVYVGRWQPRQILHLSLLLTLFIVLVSFILGQERVFGFRDALEDPNAAYALYGQSQGGTGLSYVFIFLEPFTIPLLILTAYYWQSVNTTNRWMFVLILIFKIIGAVAIAVRGAIIFQLITIGGAFLASYFGGRLKFGLLSRFQVVILVALGMTLLISYFSLIYAGRSGVADTTFNPAIGQFPDANHPISLVTPESQKPLVFGAIMYLTHGYYGLSLALDKSFVGVGFGMTNSTFIMRNFVRLTGFERLYDFSYASRLWTENGYPVGNYWITIYPWIASDVTWIGSVVILFLIGRLFAQAWLDAVQGNPAAIIIFVLLASLIYAFPMNNSLQDGSAISRTYFWLIFWWLNRKNNSNCEE